MPRGPIAGARRFDPGSHPGLRRGHPDIQEKTVIKACQGLGLAPMRLYRTGQIKAELTQPACRSSTPESCHDRLLGFLDPFEGITRESSCALEMDK
jgi:hypothetical protein